MHAKGLLLLFKGLGFFTLREVHWPCQVTKGALVRSEGQYAQGRSQTPLLISIGARKDSLRSEVVHSTLAEFNLHFLACPRIQHPFGRNFADVWSQYPQPGFYQTGFSGFCATKSHDFFGNTRCPNGEEVVAFGDCTTDPLRPYSLYRGNSGAELGW